MKISRGPTIIASALAFALLTAAASAQSPNPEEFDMSGVKGNGLTQWAIRVQVVAHKSGDMAGAAKIQEALADYYTKNGDPTRARAATAARAAALQIAAGGSGGTTTPPTQTSDPSLSPGGGGGPGSNVVPSANLVMNLPTGTTTSPSGSPSETSATSASSANPEDFDMSGVTGNGLAQWAIRVQVIAHKSGDMASAAKIQEALADYYTKKGDSARARTATAAQAAAVQITAGGSGGNPLPPTPDPSTSPAGANGFPSPATSDGATPGSPTAEASTTATGSTIESRYYYMADGVLHTWDFAADGNYLYTEIVSGAGIAGRSSERGTYSISRGILEVTVKKKTNATTSTVGGGGRTTATGGTESTREVRRYKVKLLGSGGRDGMILDRIQMKRKTW